MPQQPAAYLRFTHDRLTPAFHPDDCVELPIRLAPSTTYPKGQVLGQASATVNDLQTFTCTGTPTGGTQTFAVFNPLTGLTSNLVVPYNCSSSALQTLANAIFGAGNVTAGGGPWPGTALTLTGSGKLAGQPIPVATVGANALTGGSSPAATVAHTATGVSKGDMAKYDGTVLAAPSTAPTVAGNGAGSAFGAGSYAVAYTLVTAYGETTPSPATVVTVTAAQNLRVSAIASLNAAVTKVNYYVNGVLMAQTTPSSGTAAQTDISGSALAVAGVAPTANTAFTAPNGAGTQVPLAILEHACVTDASGLVSYGASTPGPHGQASQLTPAYFTGIFDVSQLVGLDANAVAKLGRIIKGDTTTGFFAMYGD